MKYALLQLVYLYNDLKKPWVHSNSRLKALLPLLTCIIYPQYLTAFSYRIRRMMYLFPRPLNYVFLPLRIITNSIFKILTTSEISERACLGPGLTIAHMGTVIIAANVCSGPNLNVRQGVTIGGKGNRNEGFPRIGKNVLVGAGACIIGNVQVDNFSVIGANSVVTKDISKGCVVAGAPAKVINKNVQY